MRRSCRRPGATRPPEGPIAGQACAESTKDAKHLTFGPAKLGMPVLYAAGGGESAYARAAEAMHEASSDAQLLIVPGATEHGVELVMPGSDAKAAVDGVDAFLLKHASAT